jgi:hypothetical protein
MVEDVKQARNIAISLLAGALIAAVPLYIQLRDARQTSTAEIERLTAELAAARRALTVSSIHSRLGLLLSSVRAGDFAAASRGSGSLYDDAARAADEAQDPDAQRRLRTFLSSRDEVTAALATEDPKVADRLEQLFRLLAASL